MPRPQSRRWCFTFNNWTPEIRSHLTTLPVCVERRGLRYLCFGEESGEEGTAHLQGYIEFFSPWRMTRVKSLLGADGFHLEVARADSNKNIAYCSKQEGCNFYSIGEPGRRGQRSDLDDVKVAIEEGASDEQLASSFFGQWVRYRQSFSSYRALISRQAVTANFSLESFPTQWPRELDWSKTQILWGESGIGKTEYASAMLPGALLVSHMDDLGNFDPDFHTGIIFDDVDVKHFPRTSQIHLVDQNHVRSIHIRYGTATIPPHTKKIFTTNEDCGMCVSLTDSAIRRRCNILHLGML